MYKFDTKVQHLKYKVLRTVAKHAWDSDFYESFLDIPKEIIPGKTPTMRCCVYKERAILAERVKLAAGGDRNNPNVIEALDIACDDCPTGGYTVTEACRGCIAHRCEDACPRGAITHDEFHHAHIDKSKCINCGKCAAVCPYSAIYNRKRPCQNACKIGAISMNEDGTVKIDNSKCISCGACVYQCPFGALSDKSFILDAIKMLKNCDRVYAIVAPAIVSQFTYAKPGQVIAAIKALGFCDVLEAALGADMVAYNEAAELAERGHSVVLCERAQELGGAMRYAKYVPFKQKVDQLMQVMIRRLERSGAELRLGTEATPELVEELQPDVIVAALGAKAKRPDIPGGENAIMAADALRDIDSIGQTAAVIGGGLVGCEIALQLGMMGRSVQLISRKKEVCRDAAYLYREGLLMELEKVPVTILNEADCVAVTENGAVIRTPDGSELELKADSVIWAGGYLPLDDEAGQVRALAYDFWKIGDCAQVRKIFNARREGYNAGSNI